MISCKEYKVWFVDRKDYEETAHLLRRFTMSGTCFTDEHRQIQMYLDANSNIVVEPVNAGFSRLSFAEFLRKSYQKTQNEEMKKYYISEARAYFGKK